MTHTTSQTAPPSRVAASVTAVRLPSALSRPVVFADGASLLVVGGLTASDTTTPAILRVNLSGGGSTRVGTLAVGVHDAAGAVLRGRDLVFGGGSIDVSGAVQEVSPGMPARLVGRLPTPRADLVAASDEQAAFVLGGFDGSSGSASILRTGDGITFTSTGSLPVPVRYPAVALAGGYLWLFGGESTGIPVDDVQRIDVGTGRASLVGHLPQPLAHAGAFSLGGAIFVGGGRTRTGISDAVLRFQPETLTFRNAGRLPQPQSDFGVAVVGNTAYLVGGEDPHTLDTVVAVRAESAIRR